MDGCHTQVPVGRKSQGSFNPTPPTIYDWYITGAYISTLSTTFNFHDDASTTEIVG